MTNAPPAFAPDQAAALAETLFGIRGTAAPLPGEKDLNLLLRCDDGGVYVLKIAAADEDPAILDLQHAALGHVAAHAPQLALPRPIPSRDGATICRAAGADGRSHLVSMLSYLPDRLWAETPPHTPALLRDLGLTLGTLDAALASFDHPAAARQIRWDLAAADWIVPHIGLIDDPQRRALVERAMARYRDEVRPLLPQLRQQAIHNDANDYNILLDDAPYHQRRVAGLIDVGDLCRSALVCEVAIAAAYALMGKPDVLAAAGQLVGGYHAAMPLEEREIALVFPLVAARLCVSVVNAAIQRREQPQNTYLTISERDAWELLARLDALHPRLAHYALRAACGLPSHPDTQRTVAHLRALASQIAPLLPGQRTARLTVLDWSIGSADLGGYHELMDDAALDRITDAALRDAGASIGVGRYDEPRPIYTSDIFRTAGNDGPEWRTVHVGLDLFAPAETPIHAPIAGVVHSLRENAAARDYGPTVILRHTAADARGEWTFYTLYGHLSRATLASLSVGQLLPAGARIGWIGDRGVNGGWPPHLHLQIILDLLDIEGDYPGVALPSQRQLRRDLSPDPNLLAQIPAERFPAPAMAPDAILAARQRHSGPNLSVSYRRPLTIVRGWMQHLYDVDGRAYLDAVNNVAHVGHCHPQVVAAGQRQMAVLNTNTRYLHQQLARYTERLAATLPPELSAIYLVCSGSEANELALRLARTATGRDDTVVLEVGYHGNTGNAVAVSSYKFDGPGGRGAQPHIHTAAMPDVYYGAHRGEDAAARYADDVARCVALAEARGGVGAFIAETILSCGGQIDPPEGYLAAAYAHVRRAGGLCIADEVQTGFGRVGSHFWAFATQGVVPDIVTMGKPIGNGHPIGAVATTPAIARAFANGMEYFNTFGGNPVSCAIGDAVLDVIERDGLQARAARVGAYLEAGLRRLMDAHESIGDVRGRGLFLGVELVQDRASRAPDAELASLVTNRMCELGVLMSTDGPRHNVLKIKPPLVFGEGDADALLAALARALGERLR